MQRRVVVLVAFVVLALVLAGLVAWRVLGARTDYAVAVEALPQSTLRASYTDWESVRLAVGDAAPGPAASRREAAAFVDRAYEGDLSGTSAIVGSTYPLQEEFGFSPLDIKWEVYGQSTEGAVDVVRLQDTSDMLGIERRLRTLGYDEPSGGAGRGGTWAGSADLVATIDGDLSPVQQNVVVLAEERLVLMSDSASYASTTAEVVSGDVPSLSSVSGVEDLVSVSDEPVNAILWAKDFACEDLGMADADPNDQERADQLTTDALSPLAGLVMAREQDRSVRVRMRFESSDQASANLQPRVDLASGEAVGQGGTFPDRFSISSAEADGSAVTMVLQPKRRVSLLSEISQGPILFATC